MCRRTGVQAPFEAAGFLALPSRRDSPLDPVRESRPHLSRVSGLARRISGEGVQRLPSHAGPASRSAEHPHRPGPSPSERIDNRDPASQNSFSTSAASKPGRVEHVAATVRASRRGAICGTIRERG